MLIVMDKSTQEKHPPQPLQTNKKHFKIAVFVLTSYNGLFIITNKNIKVFFTVSINDDDFNVISITPGAYELERLDDKKKQFTIKDG